MSNSPVALTNENYHLRGNGDFGIIEEEYDWSPDSSQIIFGYSPNTGFEGFYRDSSLAIINLKTLEITPLKKNAQHESSPKYSPDGKWVAYLESPSISNFKMDRSVSIYSTESKEYRKLAKTYNEGIALSGPSLLGWTQDNSGIYFFEPKKTKSALWLLPVNASEAVEIAIGEALYKELSLSHDHQHLGLTIQTPNQPPEAAFHNIRTQITHTISNLNKEFQNLPTFQNEVINWKSKDNRTIEGLLTYPIDYYPGKICPLLVFIHGGPAGVFEESFIGGSTIYPLASFAEMGFMILRPNPRGSTGYGKEFRWLNNNDWGGKDYLDILAGVDFLINKGFVDPSKLGVMGWSYGGYMTAWAISQTNRFKAASMGAGIANLVSLKGTMDLTSFVAEYLGSFTDNTTLYHEKSSIYHVKNIQTPVLIQHGMNDKRVPYSQSQEFYHALISLDKTAILHLYPDMQHRFTSPVYQLDLMKKNLEWFTKYIDPQGMR